MRGGRREALVFPVALWWFATFFFWGRWGRYLDDYVFGMRDPVTGAVDWASPFRDYFWRPLHLVVVPVDQRGEAARGKTGPFCGILGAHDLKAERRDAILL